MSYSEMKLEPGDKLFKVTVPDHWNDPVDNPMLLKATLEKAEELGANWIEMVHRGVQVLCRPTHPVVAAARSESP